MNTRPVRLLLCALGGLAGCESAGPPAEPTGPEGVADGCAEIALLGAPTPVAPAWCRELVTGPGTAASGPNRWTDDFDHHLSFASVDDAYRVFDHAPAFSPDCSARHFRHNEHWMADVGTDGCEGVLLRPDRTFRFEGGRLVVEATVAAGIGEYGGRVWPEIVVTTAPEPTARGNSDLYAYAQFPGSWSFGCRLQSERVPICALFDDSGRGTAGRTFEISFFQHEGATRVYGGEPGPVGGARDRAWRVCDGGDPDLLCRDRFRLELERDAVRVFVNDVLYMEHAGLPAGT
ncbi:MAG: hypothetical protein KC645_03955, partial [Gemmatimonadetes bacterium]|nr:hypothetical protein [Gemmatimonadota bacterium]